MKVETYADCSSQIQMYLAGFLEAILTRQEIYNFLEHFSLKNSKIYGRLAKFFEDVDASLEKKIYNEEFMKKLNETERKYWIQVKNSILFI